MQTVVSKTRGWIPQDTQSVKKYAMIVVLVALIVGLGFAMANLNFGDYTATMATLLAALIAIAVKIIDKYVSVTEYPVPPAVEVPAPTVTTTTTESTPTPSV